ncbi:serine protease [Schlesneria sp. T3-172]|uniref:S1 family peptidase n=1 Tax=Schlesneria sphaerica TaxID=3373610 RepID=UPI0037C9E59D
MPFLTRNAVGLLFVSALAVDVQPMTKAEDGVSIIRIPSVSKIVDEDRFQEHVVELTPVASGKLLKYAVKLRAKDTRSALASGVNVADGILTCAHVVEGFSEFTVECDGEAATARVVTVDEQHDLALLSVKWTQPHAEAVLTKTSPQPEEQLTSVGRQKDGTFSVELHSLQKIENREYLYTNPPQEGRSGSGIFNSDGKLVGIVLGKIVDVEPFIGRAAVVEDVKKLVTAKRAKIKVASRRSDSPTPTVVRKSLQ